MTDPDICKDCMIRAQCTCLDKQKLTRTGKCKYKQVRGI